MHVQIHLYLFLSRSLFRILHLRFWMIIRSTLLYHVNQVPIPPVCTATDECDANVQVMFSETNGPDCNFGILRTWTAIDDCGNTSSYTQVITVIDEEDPVVILPPDQTIDCTDLIPAPFSLVTDNCDEDPSVDVSELIIPGNCPQEYILQRTYTATDVCGK